MRQFKVYEISPANFLNQIVSKTLCLLAPAICKLAEYLVADTNPELNDEVAT
jgi:pyruvate carboxylase